MTTSREQCTPAEELSLLTQVRGACPLCGRGLFRRKNGRDYKGYEIAHIFPLNPRLDESVLLKDVARLSTDPNSLDNLIPLCVSCHESFDKPRTVQEYEHLAAAKTALMREDAQRVLRKQYPLEADISVIISGLISVTFEDSTMRTEISFDPKTLGSKLKEDMSGVVKRKIKHAVDDYYHHIRSDFHNLEQLQPNVSQLIYAQVRAFYQKQMTLGITQTEIFQSLVEWLKGPISSEMTEAAEIVAAYFVQNCEVFD